MKVSIATGSAATAAGAGVMVGVLKRDRKPSGPAAQVDRATGGRLAALLAAPEFSASAGRTAILRPGRGRHKCVIVVGLGSGSIGEYARAAAAGSAAAATAELDSVCCTLPSAAGLKEVQPADAVRIATQQCCRGGYRFRRGRRPAAAVVQGLSLLLPGKPSAALKRAAATGAAIGEGMNLARHLAEQPPNLCNPDFLARCAQDLGRHGSVRVRVMRKAALKRLRMEGILAVGRGSANPPCLIAASHSGGRAATAPVVLVGKGVTFDTGGISLKPGAAMDEMKFDMSGAAGVLGTLAAVARMRLPINVVAVVPAAENMPDGRSYRPGDVLRMYSGKTVEVLNTDAEGRLLLADALAWAERKYKPAAIVDAATLTGACVVALGHHRSGMFCRDEDLATALAEAGDRSADPCWRLPLDDEYDRLLSSSYADFPHIGGGRAAGTITAACFLGRFVKSRKWAHLDIAGTAWGRDKRGTGRPVGLLATWLAARARRLG